MNETLHTLTAFRDLMNQHMLFTLGVMLLTGYFLGKLINKTGLPEITGFIIAGVLLGESAFGIVPLDITPSMRIITEVALGLIALSMGSEFGFKKLRRMGKNIIAITIIQLTLTYAAVTAFMIILGMELPFALIIGAIGTASSPAVLFAVVNSLRARGEFIDYLYAVVALLDAGTVILFGISFSIAVGLLGIGAPGAGPLSLLTGALFEVVFSLLTGTAMGLLINYSVRSRKGSSEIMIISLGLLFLFTAFATVFHLSPLLINMTAGAVLINTSSSHHRIFKIIEPATPPVYALFFIMAGTELNLSLIMQPRILLLGGAYIVVRAAAKYAGTFTGAFLTKTPAAVRNYLGLCMFPQAGVSLGLVLLVQASPVTAMMSAAQQQMVGTLVNIVLLSVFLNQLIGPPLAKIAVEKGNTLG